MSTDHPSCLIAGHGDVGLRHSALIKINALPGPVTHLSNK